MTNCFGETTATIAYTTRAEILKATKIPRCGATAGSTSFLIRDGAATWTIILLLSDSKIPICGSTAVGSSFFRGVQPVLGVSLFTSATWLFIGGLHESVSKQPSEEFDKRYVLACP